MICKDCRTAADMKIPLSHLKCRGGTWCDCQHRLIQAVAVSYV